MQDLDKISEVLHSIVTGRFYMIYFLKMYYKFIYIYKPVFRKVAIRTSESSKSALAAASMAFLLNVKSPFGVNLPGIQNFPSRRGKYPASCSYSELSKAIIVEKENV